MQTRSCRRLSWIISSFIILSKSAQSPKMHLVLWDGVCTRLRPGRSPPLRPCSTCNSSRSYVPPAAASEIMRSASPAASCAFRSASWRSIRRTLALDHDHDVWWSCRSWATCVPTVRSEVYPGRYTWVDAARVDNRDVHPYAGYGHRRRHRHCPRWQRGARASYDSGAWPLNFPPVL